MYRVARAFILYLGTFVGSAGFLLAWQQFADLVGSPSNTSHYIPMNAAIVVGIHAAHNAVTAHDERKNRNRALQLALGLIAVLVGSASVVRFGLIHVPPSHSATAVSILSGLAYFLFAVFLSFIGSWRGQSE